MPTRSSRVEFDDWTRDARGLVEGGGERPFADESADIGVGSGVSALPLVSLPFVLERVRGSLTSGEVLAPLVSALPLTSSCDSCCPWGSFAALAKALRMETYFRIAGDIADICSMTHERGVWHDTG